MFFLLYMTAMSRANADNAVIEAQIVHGRSPNRELVRGAINRIYNWEFENQEYTIVVAVDRKKYNKSRLSQGPVRSDPNYLPRLVKEGSEALKVLVGGVSPCNSAELECREKVELCICFRSSTSLLEGWCCGGWK